MLPRPNHTRHEWARWDAYIYTQDPDALFAEFKQRGASFVKELSFIDDGLWGFEVKDAATGGASDANVVSGLGVPVLDGMGPVGGAAHAPGEWLDLNSVVPRVTLLAAMIASGGSGQP